MSREDTSFLVFSSRVNDADPADALVSGRIVGTTGLDFRRWGTGATAVVLRWYVAEFYGGVWVQKGSSSSTVASTTVSINAVDTAITFPLISMRQSGTTFGDDDFVQARLGSSTSLLLLRNSGNTGGNSVEWQVVSMEGTTVTTGDLSFATGDVDQTLTSPTMTPATTWLLYTYKWGGGTTNIGQSLVRGWLFSSSMLTFERNNTGTTLDLTYYLVNFTGGRGTVQSNNLDIDDGTSFELARTATLSTTVNLSKSIAMAGYTGSTGRTVYSSDDNIGTSWFTVDLKTTSTVECQRAVSGDRNADCVWQVVEFSTTGTEIDLASFEARRGPRQGVTLSWRTAHEIDNLGFHVHREKNGERVRITPNMVGGSTLLSGRGGPTLGHTYTFVDKQPAPDGTRYWLEDIDINGKSTWHGPVTPVQGPADVAGIPATQALTLEDLRGTAGSTVRPKGWNPDNRAAPDFRGRAWDVAGQSALKLGVKQDGWYRVTGAGLAAAGFDVSRDPARLALFVDGQERAILIRGGDDGRLDAADTVEFYGTAADTMWTDSRVHWLTWQPTNGRRLSVAPATSSAGPVDSYPATSELRERTIYFAALQNGAEPNLFGATVTNMPVSRTIALSDLAGPDGQALEVTLQGVTEEPHRIVVQVNGQQVGEVTFQGRDHPTRRFELAPGTLRDGDNVVTLQAAASARDVVLVDTMRLEHRRRFVASDGALAFSVPSGGVVTLEGLEPGARVLDVTNPNDVVERPVNETAGKVTVALPAGAERRYVAVDPRGPLTPDEAVLNQPSRWTAADNQGDLVLLGPKALLNSMRPLVEARRGEGWTPVAVPLKDVYDEITYGEPGPGAIRLFLRHARRKWRLPPKAVLLVGDASLDPRGWLRRGAARSGSDRDHRHDVAGDGVGRRPGGLRRRRRGGSGHRAAARAHAGGGGARGDAAGNVRSRARWARRVAGRGRGSTRRIREERGRHEGRDP